ncbi:MAG: bidirectional hydrogenase complex protein HoxU [Anaerolineales bacterium]|nr:bidirectional hydrogenase complex protein HoxU [Anaerolineales bacterium]
MDTVITLTLNGEMVSARADQTLLDIIREQKISLPTLCHMDGLSERGGCRLCAVEVQGAPRPMAACVTPVSEGMVVRTHTPELEAYRRMVLELLLAERNHICAICVTNGHCELQWAAAQAGVTSVRYAYLHPDLPMDASHGRFVLDHNRCILCTRCVRVCDEVEGAHTWDLAGRGIQARVITDLSRPWGASPSCTSCGKCVQVCPTGALFAKGATVAEMTKEHDFVSWIIRGRTKREWVW